MSRLSFIMRSRASVALSGGLLLMYFGAPSDARALEAWFHEYDSYSDSVQLADFSDQSLHFAELNDFPHNYEFTLTADTLISFQVLLPQHVDFLPTTNVLIVKKERNGSVSEVARLNAQDSSWSEVRNTMLAETFLAGETFADTLPAGQYILEVNTPDNRGQYLLQVGANDDFSISEWLRAPLFVYETKRFLGRSIFSVFASPVYYVPMGFSLLVIGFWLYLRPRRVQA